MTTGKAIALTTQMFVSKVMSLLFNIQTRDCINICQIDFLNVQVLFDTICY